MQYVKIRDAVVEQIECGALSAGQKLPAERQLAEAFSTTRVTLREALSVLETEGLIYREDRRGWFISLRALRYDPAKQLSFSRLAVEQEREPDTTVISAESKLATKESAKLLGLPPFSDVYSVELLHLLEGRPVAYVKNYIKKTPFPNFLDNDLTSSFSVIYRERYGITCHKTCYRIRMASLVGDIAQALRATPGTPAMLVERINYSQDGAIIDSALEYWRHDAVRIESLAEVI